MGKSKSKAAAAAAPAAKTEEAKPQPKPKKAAPKAEGDRFFDVFLKGVHVGSTWAKDEAQAIDRVYKSTESQRAKVNYSASLSTRQPAAEPAPATEAAAN